jgi:hypothetical protein
MSINIFEKASRVGLRFPTTKGLISTEDLWGLSLTSLDQVAQRVYKQIKETPEVSFIGKKTTNDTELELQLEILKHVIEYKQAAADAAKTRLEKQQKVSKLQELIEQKKNQQLTDSSLEELEKMLQAELG